ncbi:Na(+)-translocating NADH-quinone reductase subunit A [Salinibius halmophilus]|uniref:Na(+)-translocating NADH-quinone reductase subunit A n=1 Tax=Salinibius halmophilus TaxID=1853216 RepID=UPI000E66904B|nr:Na(+)-translocating NADH-quinone reductase subunit A [Salinibius halmophilus]
MIKIKKGLDLPITGQPEQRIDAGAAVSTVALVGYDYVGMKPTMAVREGDKVKKGQVLFTDKKTAGVQYTSPVAGEVIAVNRGARRVFESLVIKKEGDEEVTFKQYSSDQLAGLERQAIVDQLVESGQWTALRTRPFSKVPAIDSTPADIFVNAMDTNPLAADPAVIIAEKTESFKAGLQILRKLTEGKLFVVSAPNSNVPSIDGATTEQFDGPHPAGLVGTHIHFLSPVHAERSVWHIGYQDVIAFGELFLTGRIYTQRVVAVAGPKAKQPRLVRTEVGASLNELVANEAKEGDNRIISGSVFGGRLAKNATAYLGRFHSQVSILEEGHERILFRYLRAGFNMHSVTPIFASVFGKKKLDFTTTTNGSERAMVPIGQYERVMPLDILPTQLLRALAVGDIETAERLGCLELDEEDLALCTYACVGKYEYGPILRENLTRIELEG